MSGNTAGAGPPAVTDHVIFKFSGCLVALKIRVSPVVKVPALAGTMVIAAGFTVTDAVPVTLLLSTDVAVIVALPANRRKNLFFHVSALLVFP